MTRQDKFDFFEWFTHTKSREEIRIEQKRKRRKLTREERNAIIRKNARKAKLRIGLAALGLVSLGSGVIGFKAKSYINSVEPKINIEGKDREFIGIKDLELGDEKTRLVLEDKDGNSYQIDENEMSFNEKMDKAIDDEINQLDNKEDVLNYAKEVYAKAYNENNEEKITKDQILLYKRKRSQFKNNEE